MSISTLIALVRFLIWAVQTVQEAYGKLTPEEKEQIHQDYLAWQEAIKAVQDPMAGPADGSGP